MFLESTPQSRYFKEEHHILRESLREYITSEISPYIEKWEEDGEVPRELYEKSGDVGLLGVGFPEQYGGAFEGDEFAKLVGSEVKDFNALSSIYN